MKISLPFLLTILLISAIQGKSQKITGTINAYTELFPIEKMHIHYDKSAYVPGDTIWFKGYFFENFLPGIRSKTLYIDWADETGKIFSRSVCPIIEAYTFGQINIPENLKGHSIVVSAYTKWMLNADSALLYKKTLKLYSSDIPRAALKTLPVPTIDFLPESGNFVAGYTNKIAFKAIDQWGRPVEASGVVKDHNKNLITNFSSQHDGMGFLTIKPEIGAKYTAIWKDKTGKEFSTPLPDITQGGAIISTKILDDKLDLKIYFSQQFASQNDSFYLVGSYCGQPIFEIYKPATTTVYSASIPTQGLLTGMYTVTLFNGQQIPVAERICFINNGEAELQPTIEVARWGLNKKSLNTLKIAIPDSIYSNFSLSVTDVNLYHDTTENILTRLLLTGELKGQVNNPAQYFKTNDSTTRNLLDLVMLTNGWRKINWNAALQKTIAKPKFEMDTSFLTLSGNALGVRNRQVSDNEVAIVFLESMGGEKKFIMMPINGDGSFNDPSTVIFDTAKVFFQFNKDSKLKDAAMEFLTTKLGAPGKVAVKNTWPDTSNRFAQVNMFLDYKKAVEGVKGKMLENVTVKSKVKSKEQLLDEKYSSPMFRSDGYLFDLVNDPLSGAYLGVFNYLQGKVAGLQINTNGGDPSLSWRGGAPAVYVNEMLNEDLNFVSTMNMSDVAMIKVFRPPFMGGFNGANGAIAIYTKRGDDYKADYSNKTNDNLRKIIGYTSARQFYSPKYSEFAEPNDLKDLRTTLYWNPVIEMDGARKTVTVSFYNNEMSNAFRVVLEGVNADGKLAHVEMLME